MRQQPDKQLILDSLAAIARGADRPPSRSEFVSLSGISEHSVSQFFPSISSPGVEIRDAAVHLDALKRYRQTKVHFVDCLIAAAAAAENTPVATFDQDFRKFADVRVENQ